MTIDRELTTATGPVADLTATAAPIRVLLVDDKLLVREGVRALLERQGGFRIVGQAGTLAEALTADAQPDVIVIDLVLPDARGTELVVQLRVRFPRASIVVLTDVEARLQVELIVAAGAGAYVLKRASTDEFVTGIRIAAQGRQYVHPSLRFPPVAGAPATGASAADPADDSSLTDPEREVVRLLVLGHTNAEIAALCSVSLRTVEARRARVLRKLGVRTRAELVRVAQQLTSTDIDLV